MSSASPLAMLRDSERKGEAPTGTILIATARERDYLVKRFHISVSVSVLTLNA